MMGAMNSKHEAVSQKRLVAIVTGGGRGIGKEIARSFFEQGIRVVICARSQQEITATCSEIDPKGERSLGIQADVSNVSDCEKLISFALERFGRIDILVNNAGIYGEIGEFERNDPEGWRKTIEVNLFGTMHCTKLVIPVMKKTGGGTVINFAGGGVGGKRPLPHFSAYYTSKVAIVGFTETVAAEIAKWGIRMNCISPGPVNTGITDYLIEQGPEKAGIEMYNQALTQKKTGGISPKTAVDLVSFLCLPEASHITGRLLSAKWDAVDVLKNLTDEDDMFKLRRIDNALFYGK